MKKALFLLLFLFPTLLLAQQSGQDLEQNEQRLKDLKGRINLKSLSLKDRKHIIQIIEIYKKLDLDSALHYAELELKLAKKTENPDIISYSKLENAGLLYKLQKPDQAQKLLLENISNRTKISDYILAATYFRIAKVGIQQQRPAESIQYVFKAIPIFKTLKDSSNLADCYSHIAGIYTFVLAEPENAISYFNKALAYTPSEDVKNLIRININFSSAYVGAANFKQALKRIQKAERISREANYLPFIPSIYVQYSLVYHNFGQYSKSLEYARLADSEFKKVPNFDPVAQDKIYWYLGVNYKELKEYRKAINYLERIEESLYVDQTALQSHLIELYAEVGDFEHAFKLQEKLRIARDSSDILTRNQQVVDVVEKYESEKKQRKIQALNEEKIRQKSELRTQRFILYGTITFFLVLIVIGAYGYRTRTKLKEAQLNLETMKLQQRFLRTQLNPHFLFHALTSIETYIYKNDKLKSAGFLRSFSVLMRNILEFSDLDFIPLQQDIDFIRNYIELQQLNNEFKFQFEITVSPELNTEEIMIPPMLIQPAVENAILHGALSVEHGLIAIEYAKVEDQLQISIIDNGKTNARSGSSSNRLHRSMSLDITHTRIKNIEEVHGLSIVYFPFDANNNEQNTVVLFKMPIPI